MHKQQIFKIAFFPLAVLVIHILVTMLGLYEGYWWMDIPLHFIGGIAIGFSTYYLLEDFEKRNLLIIHSKLLKILLIISVTALTAVAWEVMEYFTDFYGFTVMQASIMDTMKDLSMGIIGGTIAAIYKIFRK